MMEQKISCLHLLISRDGISNFGGELCVALTSFVNTTKSISSPSILSFKTNTFYTTKPIFIIYFHFLIYFSKMSRGFSFNDDKERASTEDEGIRIGFNSQQVLFFFNFFFKIIVKV